MRRGRNLQVVGERTEQTSQQPSQSEAEYRAATAALKEKEAQYEAAIATVKTAFAILGSRAQLIMAGLGSAAFFGWSIYSSQWIALAGATIYTVLVFLPSLYASRHSG